MAANDPIATPLVADGLALIAQYQATQAERAKLAKQLEPLDATLKSLGAQISTIEEQLIEKGAGLYGEGDQLARVNRGVPKKLSPDTFVLPDGGLEDARALAGAFFKKLFDRRIVIEPKAGFGAIADAVLTPAKARELVALCIIPGSLKGGRSPSVTWPTA